MKNQIKNWIKNQNGIHLAIAVSYYIFFQILIGIDVGTYTSGPMLVTIWDVIWIPFVAVIWPMILGYLIKK